MSNKLTLATYWDKLRQHDWYYYMSDDPGVYHKGERERASLKSQANISEAHLAMYTEFAQGRRPERPE